MIGTRSSHRGERFFFCRSGSCCPFCGTGIHHFGMYSGCAFPDRALRFRGHANLQGNGRTAVDPRTPKVTDASEVLSSYGQDSAAIASQVEVHVSSNVLQKVIASQNIINDPSTPRAALLSIFPANQRRMKMPSWRLSGRTWKSCARDDLCHHVSYTSNDPNKAARIANASSKPI